MTADDRFDVLDRRIEAGLTDLAMPLKPDYLDDVLRLTARTAQRPPLLSNLRFRPMNRLSLVALVAAVAVAFVGGAILLSRATPPSVGATPSPIASPTATPAPTLLSTVPAPQTTWGDWVADVDLHLPNQGPRIQLSINWDGGKTAWIQTNYDTGTQVYNSEFLAAPDGQLAFVSQVTADGCRANDIGTYTWSRSADGEFLTLTPINDDCANRATAIGRTWVHTLSAVTDGGRGVLPVNNLELTVPHQRLGLGGRANAADLTNTFTGGPFLEFLAMRDPDTFGAPCAATATARKPAIGGPTAAAAVAYVQSLPGFSVKTEATTIDGHPATHLVATPKAGATCAAGKVYLFPFIEATGDDWTIDVGTPLSVWVTETGGHAWLFWYRADGLNPADEASVIASIHFITQLPTP